MTRHLIALGFGAVWLAGFMAMKFAFVRAYRPVLQDGHWAAALAFPKRYGLDGRARNIRRLMLTWTFGGFAVIVFMNNILGRR